MLSVKRRCATKRRPHHLDTITLVARSLACRAGMLTGLEAEDLLSSDENRTRPAGTGRPSSRWAAGPRVILSCHTRRPGAPRHGRPRGGAVPDGPPGGAVGTLRTHGCCALPLLGRSSLSTSAAPCCQPW